MQKRFILPLLLYFIFGFLLAFSPLVFAAEPQDKVVVAVFVREGCAHCKNEEQFISGLSKKVAITPRLYRLEDAKQRAQWEKFTEKHTTAKVTPITVIGNYYLVGFDNEHTTGARIKQLIEEAQKSKIKTDINSATLREAGTQNSTCSSDSEVCVAPAKTSYTISVPLLGKINTSSYPLFVLAAILGFIDGFNPCAMWVLITFLIILLEIGDRKKMFYFAGTFIFAEAIMYTLILTAWYKTWDFVRLDSIVTPIIGIVSIIGGILFMREWHKKELACKVTNISDRAKTRNKIQMLATNKFTILTFIGILGIAFSVNIIEFACSIGIPQAFTKILEMNNLPLPQWLFLIGIYIFFYMVDDLVVFGVALWGANHLGITTKYSKLSNLIGGILMIILGLLLIFNSQRLLF